MILIVEELRTTITQTINLNLNRRHVLGGVRPYLLMYNAPSGTFTLKIKQGATTLASQDFTSAEMKTDMSTSNNYIHMYKVIEFDNPVMLKNGAYDVELSSSGYTYSASSYLGWVKEFENPFHDINGTVSGYGDYPHTLQLFEKVRTEHMAAV